MAGTHIVWDWNGTLLDDLPIVVEAVNRSISSFGSGPIDATSYRDHYTRPVRAFYHSLLGREILDHEWERLNDDFHEAYYELATGVGLAPDAMDAIDLVDSLGWTQSLLSMSEHDWLESIVSRLGLMPRMARVDGLTGEMGGLKAGYLKTHLERLGVDGKSVVMIGDTPDDVAAARRVGGTPVLYHGGSHHLELLTALGVPVAETLVEAVEIARAIRSPAKR